MLEADMFSGAGRSDEMGDGSIVKVDQISLVALGGGRRPSKRTKSSRVSIL